MAKRQAYYIDHDNGDENMYFDVYRICVTLSKLQFTIMIGLKCYGNMNINHSKLRDHIWDSYFISDFKSTKIVKRETMKLMFEKLQAVNDENVVKVALVYLSYMTYCPMPRMLMYILLFFVWLIIWMHLMSTLRVI